MKKIFILTLILIFICLLAMPAHADETPETETTVIEGTETAETTEETGESTADSSYIDTTAAFPETTTAANSETSTASTMPGTIDEQGGDSGKPDFSMFLSRLKEWYEENKTNIWVQVATFLSALVLFYLKYRISRRMATATASSINASQTTTRIIDVVNQLIAAYNVSQAQNEEIKSILNNVLIHSENAKETSVATLDILDTVYTKSRNIPTGTKDLIDMKYVNAMKKISGIIDETNETGSATNTDKDGESL